MEKLELIADAVEFIRAKVDQVSNKMGFLSGAVGGLVEKMVVGKLGAEFDKRVTKKKASPKKTKKKSK